MDLVVARVVATPLLIGAASFAGRRWGHHIGGWLVALPLTSGPVAFFLAIDHGLDFAAHAAVGMMAGTISQVAFALAYRRTARHGRTRAIVAGCAGFAAATVVLASAHLSVAHTFAVTAVVVTAGVALVYPSTTQPPDHAPTGAPTVPPRWDVPTRMLVATLVVLAITALAPIIGPYAAGLLSPFPVFGAVVAAMTHHVYGPLAAESALNGLITGLAAPAMFFLVLALGLTTVGLPAFAIAALTALATQALTVLAVPPTCTG